MPVLFLTALGGVDDRVEGLDAGGDDYLVKPFAFSELLARVNALARRPHTKSISLAEECHAAATRSLCSLVSFAYWKFWYATRAAS